MVQQKLYKIKFPTKNYGCMFLSSPGVELEDHRDLPFLK